MSIRVALVVILISAALGYRKKSALLFFVTTYICYIISSYVHKVSFLLYYFWIQHQ